MSSTAIRSELKSARTRAVVSVALNIFLMVIKAVAGVKANSSALLGDAIHSGTDVFASAAAFLGLWLAGREHPSFPYGLYKAETVATLVSAIAVIVAGYEIGRQALFGPERMPDVAIALPVTVFCLAVALIFGFLQMRAGERLHSPALKADARDYLADSLSTAVVLIGLVATSLGWPLDRWAAAGVSLFVFRAGGELLLMAVKDLLDGAIDRETEREIIQMVETCPQVTRVKKCLSRTAGGRFIVDMDVIMHTPSHKLADQAADRLEEDIPVHFPRVIMARIRPHYASGNVVKRVVPVTGPAGELSDHLGSAAWFLLETINKKDSKIMREYVENPHVREEKKKGLLVGRWLLSFKPDQLAVSDGVGKDGVALVLLREAGVEIVTVTQDNFKTEEASLSSFGDVQ
ncbi:MAG: cation diffusion facilitator family transporter [Pseudomonadota bacterium]